MSTHPSRRTVVRTAAWTVPAVTVIGAAPQFAASFVNYGPAGGAYVVDGNVTNPLAYPLGNLNMSIAMELPTEVHTGDNVDARTMAVTVDVPAGLADVLIQVGNTSVTGGTANVSYALAGVLNESLNAILTIQPTPVDPAGFTITATGTSPAFAAGGSTGAVTASLVSGDVNMTFDGTSIASADIALSANVAGQVYTLGAFTVS